MSVSPACASTSGRRCLRFPAAPVQRASVSAGPAQIRRQVLPLKVTRSGREHADLPQQLRQVLARATDTAEQIVTAFNEQATSERLGYLEKQAISALKEAVDKFDHPVFPCALIAGDVVILHLLHKAKLLDKVKVVFIDTLHLFEETITFLRDCEDRYGFKAEYYTPKDFSTSEEYQAEHGVDLPVRDIELFDKICKVEPFQRALLDTKCDIMINGRRRDHGAERAHLHLFDVGRNKVANCQPLAYWEFRDCFDYADVNGVKLHPLHDAGYPSLGDVHSTLPVDRSQWFEYGAERSGRFQGLQNSDGSSKTECGIHTVEEEPEETVAASSELSSPLKRP